MKKSYLFCTAYACLVAFCTNSSAAAISGQGTWGNQVLLARDLDGNKSTIEAYYDTVLDITWLADSNYAGTAMDWWTATSWVTGLDFNGITGWRLPTVTDVGNDGCNFAFSGGTDCGYNVDTSTGEMASMFYDNLGNLAAFDTSGNRREPGPGWGLSNTGPFLNLQSSAYWTATESTPDLLPSAWVFEFNDGSQAIGFNKSISLYAWAVHSGDVGAVVPAPAAVWLFTSGLLGLFGIAKRKAIADED